MTDADKSVFISYRRSINRYLARAIAENLRANGFDVFMDVNNADSGAMDQILLNQIQRRRHFLILISPGSLDRCQNEDDWMRMEIEHAMRSGKNIVPILDENYAYDADVRKYLPASLQREFLRVRGMPVYHDFFDEAMNRLRTQFLKATPVAAVQPIQQTISEEQNISLAKKAYQRALVRPLTDYDGRIQDCTEAIRLNPQHAPAYRERGVCYSNKGQLDRAIKDFNHALRLNPDDADAYRERGVCYSIKGQEDRAIEDYNHALKLKPDDAVLYRNRGGCYSVKGQEDRAIEDYNRALKLKPDDAVSYLHRGMSYSKKGQEDRAIEDYDHALTLNPHDADAYRIRGVSYSNKGQEDRAIEDYNHALKLKPDDAVAFRSRATSYYKKEDFESVIEDTTQAISLAPSDAYSYFWRGAALHAKQNFLAALHDFQKYLELNGDPNFVSDWIAECKRNL